MGEEVKVAIRQDGDLLVLAVRGDLDIGSLSRLRMALADVCQQPGTSVLLDLSEVHFLSAAALGLLAVTARRLRRHGCRFVVLGLSPLQQRVVRICGLETSFAGTR